MSSTGLWCCSMKAQRRLGPSLIEAFLAFSVFIPQDFALISSSNFNWICCLAEPANDYHKMCESMML